MLLRVRISVQKLNPAGLGNQPVESDLSADSCLPEFYGVLMDPALGVTRRITETRGHQSWKELEKRKPRPRAGGTKEGCKRMSSSPEAGPCSQVSTAVLCRWSSPTYRMRALGALAQDLGQMNRKRSEPGAGSSGSHAQAPTGLWRVSPLAEIPSAQFPFLHAPIQSSTKSRIK